MKQENLGVFFSKLIIERSVGRVYKPNKKSKQTQNAGDGITISKFNYSLDIYNFYVQSVSQNKNQFVYQNRVKRTYSFHNQLIDPFFLTRNILLQIVLNVHKTSVFS